MTKEYDLIVIGTGAAASTAAYECRSAGWEVAVIDSRPFGGTCALRGCDPKKVLVGAAELIDWHTRMTGNGVMSKEVRIDWSLLMRFKNSFTEPVPESHEKGFAKSGIDIFHGRARFDGQTTLKVGKDTLIGRHVLIATGAMPVKLNIPGEEYITTSEEFLELGKLPQEIVFIGGGFISFEFAHIAARAGAQVCILHRSDRPLKGFDPDLVNRLVQATRDIGVDVQLNAAVTAIEKDSNYLIVSTSAGNTENKFRADMVVHGAGRVPEIEDLGLENAGVESDSKRGIIINEYLQSVSNPAVYAAGDVAVTEGPPLTPVASLEGHVVASNMLKGNQKNPDYRGIPSVVFTIPPLATVGMQEKAANDMGLNFKTIQEDTSGWYSSRRVAEKYSGFKTLVEEDSNHILGAHVLGPHAEEVINIFGLAIRNGLGAAEIRKMIYAYPTSSSDISYMV